MDSARIIVTIAGVALILLTLWFFFGKRKKKGADTGEGPYSCPMHPWIRSSDPALLCSICGMKLQLDDTRK
jgi:LPXTG-motif cell wall-anchored protein